MVHTAFLNLLLRCSPPVFCITLVTGQLLTYLSQLPLSLSPTGLSYITSVVRESEELSTWFCYFIPAQLVGNWVQFLQHRSFVPVSVDNYPGYVHT